MTKLVLLAVLVCVLASIPAVTLMADGPDDSGVISFKGKVNWSLATTPSATDLVVNPNPALLAVIFSNLKANHLYAHNAAWDVTGSDSGEMEQSVAMPFTPTFDAEVLQIAVAVEHKKGSPNSFLLSLNANDVRLLPGKVLHSWILKDAPQFGTCCTLDMASDRTGLKVKKGTQYWVVARTETADSSTRMAWNLSLIGGEQNFAFNNGQGWYEFTAFPSAFAVYGKKLVQQAER